MKTLEETNNRRGLTGKLNGLRLPSKHRQQAAALNIGTSQNQIHPCSPRRLISSTLPYITATLEAPSTLSLSAPYRIEVILQHQHNPAGNANEWSTTFCLKDQHSLLSMIRISIPGLYSAMLETSCQKSMTTITASMTWGRRHGRRGWRVNGCICIDRFCVVGYWAKHLAYPDLYVTDQDIIFEVGDRYSFCFRGTCLY